MDVEDSNVLLEVKDDMIFISWVLEMQGRVANPYLKETYTEINIIYLSIVLHECLNRGLLDKQKANKDVVKMLKDMRTTLVKIIPKEDGSTINKTIKEMGIDLKYYAFELVLTINDKTGELVANDFSYWNINKTFKANIDVYNSLIRIPVSITQLLFENFSEDEKRVFKGIINDYTKMLSELVETKINLSKRAYSITSLFNKCCLEEQDKMIILYYYSAIYRAKIIDDLLPNLFVDETRKIFDLEKCKTKYRAIIIQNFGSCLQDFNTPLVEELKKGIDRVIIDKSFFRMNRELRNNLHYKRTTLFSKEQIKTIYNLQQLYLDEVINIFSKYISCSFGIKYKFVKWIVEHTDETILEVKKYDKNIKHFEDISEKQWIDARNRIEKSKE